MKLKPIVVAVSAVFGLKRLYSLLTRHVISNQCVVVGRKLTFG
jgi:hypothetical protein